MTEPPDEFLVFARSAFEHRECRAHTQERAGDQFEVTTAHPSLPVAASVRCPHGVRYWLVPVEPVAQWVKDGTP